MYHSLLWGRCVAAAPPFFIYMQLVKYTKMENVLLYKLGCTDGVMLSLLIAMHSYYESENQLVDGWFYCTADAIEKRTGLTRRQQDAIVLDLKKNEFIETKLKGSPPIKHFKLNINRLKNFITEGYANEDYDLPKLLDSISTKSENQFIQKVENEFNEKSKTISTKSIAITSEDNTKINTLEKEKESGEILQISPTPTPKIEIQKTEPKPKRKKMETTNEPKDYTEVLKNATQGFLDLDDELIELWNILNNEKNWKLKSDHARHLQAISLIDYNAEFLKVRLKYAITGNEKGAHHGIIYKNTPQDFEDFLKNPTPQTRNTGGLNREIWDSLIASRTFTGIETNYDWAVKYYENVKSHLPERCKLRMFNERELCTIFSLATEPVKAQKIKDIYKAIAANPEKYNHYGTILNAINQIINS